MDNVQGMMTQHEPFHERAITVGGRYVLPFVPFVCFAQCTTVAAYILEPIRRLRMASDAEEFRLVAYTVWRVI